jgi:hypothetical protein
LGEDGKGGEDRKEWMRRSRKSIWEGEQDYSTGKRGRVKVVRIGMRR